MALVTADGAVPKKWSHHMRIMNNDLVPTLNSAEDIRTDAFSAQFNEVPAGAALPTEPISDGVEIASILRYGNFFDNIWAGEKKPKKEETITCPVGQEPTVVIEGREVTVTCGPANPDKPKNGLPVPIIY
ncbi:MAG TPA: hypothetical protein VGF45_04015 [Polyangia bacterium]